MQVTRDGGTTWTNVTAKLPGLPPLGTVSNIEPSRYDAGAAYLTVDLHQVNNRDPWIYRTDDYGASWKLISGDIPKTVFSYAHCVREDPKRKGLLYAGTENSLFASFNDGESWIPLQTNMPHAPVHWIVIQENFNDLVVATYGRGFYIMDDVTPLQQLNDEVLASDAHLFEPRHAYRFRTRTRIQSYPNDQCSGQNPPYGASINYYLKSAPEGDVKITITDGTGKVVRTVDGTTKTGVNRVWWDLRYEAPEQAKLRNKPPGNPNVWSSDRFKENTHKGYIPLIRWGIVGGLSGPLAVPGNYSVKLTVGDNDLTQELTVTKDPNSTGTLADIRAQFELALAIRDDLNTVVDSINRIEWTRKQVNDLLELLEEDAGAEPVVTAGRALDEKLVAVESRFFQPILAEGDLKSFRAPNKLYSQLALLAGDVGNGSADFPPTTQQVEVYEELKGELTAAQAELRDVLSRDVTEFNTLLGTDKIPHIVTDLLE